MEHSIWFVPAIILVALVLYQFTMPVLLQYKIKERRIEVWALWIIRLASIRFEDIQVIKIASSGDKAPWQLIARYVNRPLSTHVFIERRRGFPRKILITPKNPEQFISTVSA